MKLVVHISSYFAYRPIYLGNPDAYHLENLVVSSIFTERLALFKKFHEI